MIHVYGLKACDTCRAALKDLRGSGREVGLVDVRETLLTSAQLTQLLGMFGEALVNRRSTTWRGLSEEQRAGEPLGLLRQHPTLMKRPVIEGDDRLTLGWGKGVQAQWLD